MLNSRSNNFCRVAPLHPSTLRLLAQPPRPSGRHSTCINPMDSLSALLTALGFKRDSFLATALSNFHSTPYAAPHFLNSSFTDKGFVPGSSASGSAAPTECEAHISAPAKTIGIREKRSRRHRNPLALVNWHPSRQSRLLGRLWPGAIPGFHAVHGGIGRLDQIVAILGVLRVNRGAHAERHRDRGAVDVIGSGQLRADFLLHYRRALLVFDFRQHDDELVPSVTAGRIRLAKAGGQAPRDFLQDLVPFGMPELVVDRLESVHIEEHQRHPPPVMARRARGGLVEAVEQEAAIGQSGERIVIREMARHHHFSLDLDQFGSEIRIGFGKGFQFLLGLCPVSSPDRQCVREPGQRRTGLLQPPRTLIRRIGLHRPLGPPPIGERDFEAGRSMVPGSVLQQRAPLRTAPCLERYRARDARPCQGGLNRRTPSGFCTVPHLASTACGMRAGHALCTAPNRAGRRFPRRVPSFACWAAWFHIRDTPLPPSITFVPDHNRLLAALPACVFDRLVPDLQLVLMPLGKVIYEPGVELEQVYFPVPGCIVSMLYVMTDGASAEIAVVGDEGMVGIALFMGGGTTPSRALVQSSGQAFLLKGNALKREFDRHGEFQVLLLRYTQALITQMSQTAVCNRHHSVEQQLCRWLLLSLDRLPTNELTMTQELIANMLGVRREAITEAAGNLQRAGFIHYRRGHISVTDRSGLEAGACECYAVVKRESDRLLS